MRRKWLLVLAVVLGIALAFGFAQFDVKGVQSSFQQTLGVGEIGGVGQVPGVWVALAVAFVVGLSMVLTPCFLPVLLSFAPATREARSRKELGSNLFFYSLGMVLVSGLIGLVVGFAGRAVLNLLEGYFASSGFAAVVIFSFMGAVFLLWGLESLGFVRLPGVSFFHGAVGRLEESGVGQRTQSLLYGGLVGSALGVGCPIPTYHAVVLWAAVMGSPLFGALLLAVLGLGRIIPLVILVALPYGTARVWKDWMMRDPEKIHKINGFTVTLLGTFLLVFWIGVMYIGLG